MTEYEEAKAAYDAALATLVAEAGHVQIGVPVAEALELLRDTLRRQVDGAIDEESFRLIEGQE